MHFAGVVAGTPVVSVVHPGGVKTTYEPVVASVVAGSPVRRGQVLGTLADPATLPEHARKPQGLSWGARLLDAEERYVDPMSLLGGIQVRLLE
ncbi:hypothetical protein DLJ54_03660 [Corynebacterium heidelbergense]|uniref:Peptidase M23 domain-containing protein n=1 Tax=Corynebacterium heidelbergense TaxID=2055947 RepID=A0A364V753_9CORY|nr:hypothetical protein DLJ54_03660 [Corynebacterium heidelbergense]